MRTLFAFIVKHHVILLFLLLQSFCVVLIVQNNEPQRSNFISSSNAVFARVFSVNQAISQYFNLVQINNNLAEQNANLLKNQIYSKIDRSFELHNEPVPSEIPNNLDQEYEYIVAKVINNSTNKPNNYLTLDKGWRQGIAPDMAVISANGIVGVVTNVSQNFSTVMSVLHAQYRVSAKFKNSNYFGSLYWQGENYQIASLTEIPFHVKFDIGDTLVTNEFSNIYPGDIMIGTVKSFNTSESDNFYGIDVELATDFKKLEYVFVVYNLFKKERENLESLNN
ncbi:MAG: rod shape-determining protein MreC [Bacteroidales bacterium]|jgi:rod shape-determining protein MreC|nr:rod shape-determining protein MreC [Bacteroidales bacterium]